MAISPLNPADGPKVEAGSVLRTISYLLKVAVFAYLLGGSFSLAEGNTSALDEKLLSLSKTPYTSESEMKLTELVQAGANVNATWKNGNTSLHSVVYRGDRKATQLLLEYGADPNQLNSGGSTPLSIAYSAGHLDSLQKLELLRLMLKHGGNANIGEFHGNPLLIILIGQNDLQAVTMVLESGADANIRNSMRGQSAIHLAIKNGYSDIVSLLLKHGAKLNQMDESGKTASEFARYYDSPKMTKAMTSGREVAIEKALLALEEKSKRTAQRKIDYQLVNTLQAGNAAAAKELLRRGASANARDTPSDHVVPGMPKSALTIAAMTGNRELVSMLLAAKADINIDRGAPLRLAAKENRLEIVEQLLKSGADVNQRGDNAAGIPALVHAAYNQNQEMIELILKYRPDLTDRYTENWRALFAACQSGNVAIARALIKAGADVDYRSNRNHTPAIRAAEHGRLAILKMLAESGADMNASNMTSDTNREDAKNFYGGPLDWARHKGHHDVVQYLSENKCKFTICIIDVIQVVP